MYTRSLPYGQMATLQILRYSGGHLVTPMSTRPFPYVQASLRIQRYSGGPIISVFLHIFAELRYRCQVPGCGAIIKRPWNHLNQSTKHSDLSPAARRLYSDLTKSVGEGRINHTHHSTPLPRRRG